VRALVLLLIFEIFKNFDKYKTNIKTFTIN